MTDLAFHRAMAIIGPWYADQRWCIPDRKRGGLMLGAVVWGQWYLDMLRDYCLPSLMAPENRDALADDVIAIYTSEAEEDAVHDIVRHVRAAGIAVDIHTIPAAVLAASDRPFLCLSAAQQLLVTRAARAGMDFHQLHPDHSYSERYVPVLKKLGARHGNIAHGGLNVSCPPLPALDLYRGNGALVVPARELATIGWDNTIMCAMNGTAPDRMPDEHYQVWRARDRVMLFNCYANPAFIPAAVCKKLDTAQMTTGTLDCHTKSLFRADFYVPTSKDDLAFVALGDASQRGRATNYTSLDAFLDRMWREIGGQADLLAYYLRPTEMAASIDESAPTAEEVMARQTALLDMAVERARKAA